MRLVHAVTANDLFSSGHTYDANRPVWTRVAKTPIWMYSAQGSVCYPYTVAQGIRFWQTNIYFSLPVGQAAKSWKENEVLSCGYYLAAQPGYTLDNRTYSALRISSKVGEEGVCTWADIYPFTDDGTSAFIEYRISYDLKTVTVMANGRPVLTTQLTMNHDRETLCFYFYSMMNAGGWNTMKDVYAAFFDPAIEKPYLTRWSCETLALGATDLANVDVSDGVTSKLGLDVKNLEFSYAGTNKIKAAVVSMHGYGLFPEIGVAKLKSGANEVTVTTPNLPTNIAETWVTPNLSYGILAGSVDFDNTSKKLTASLKLTR